MTRMTRPDDKAGLRGYVQFNKYTHIHTYTQWHRMTRMTGPDCAVTCNLINAHTHTHIHTHIHTHTLNTHTHIHKGDQCEWH